MQITEKRLRQIVREEAERMQIEETWVDHGPNSGDSESLSEAPEETSDENPYANFRDQAETIALNLEDLALAFRELDFSKNADFLDTVDRLLHLVDDVSNIAQDVSGFADDLELYDIKIHGSEAP